MNHLLLLSVIEEPCMDKGVIGSLIIQLTAWRAKMRYWIAVRKCIHPWISQTLLNLVSINILKDGVRWGRHVPLMKHSKSDLTGIYSITLLCCFVISQIFLCLEKDCMQFYNLKRCSIFNHK